jgi:Protein of unknown function (DUF1449).
VALLLPQLAPFTLALGLLALIVIAEIGSVLIGASVSGMIDGALPDLDTDIDVGEPGQIAPEIGGGNVIVSILAWLSVGKVPVLIVLAALLFSFGVMGVVIQNTVSGTLGFMLPAWLAVIPAFIIALPMTRYIGLGLARVMPREETSAVSTDTFIGRLATIIRGVASEGVPAEAKLKDSEGLTHYLLVAPLETGMEFEPGTQVLIVQQSGATFLAIPNPHPASHI